MVFSVRVFLEFQKKIEYFRTDGVVFCRQVGFFVFRLLGFQAVFAPDRAAGWKDSRIVFEFYT